MPSCTRICAGTTMRNLNHKNPQVLQNLVTFMIEIATRSQRIQSVIYSLRNPIWNSFYYHTRFDVHLILNNVYNPLKHNRLSYHGMKKIHRARWCPTKHFDVTGFEFLNHTSISTWEDKLSDSNNEVLQNISYDIITKSRIWAWERPQSS